MRLDISREIFLTEDDAQIVAGRGRLRPSPTIYPLGVCPNLAWNRGPRRVPGEQEIVPALPVIACRQGFPSAAIPQRLG
jgi:hypothetical protein